MGWSSAGDIIEPFLTELVCLDKVNPGLNLGVAVSPAIVKLIEELQNRDWDTEDEVLAEFKSVPWIVGAFEARGVSLNCQGECEDCGQTCGKERV